MYLTPVYDIIKNSNPKWGKGVKEAMEKKKIAVVTDSNSGITQQCAGELGITVLPMPFYINEQLFLEGITQIGRAHV